MCSWPRGRSAWEAAARFAEVDYGSRMAFAALVSGELVGLAGYDRPGTAALAAEASFVVTGAYQRPWRDDFAV